MNTYYFVKKNVTLFAIFLADIYLDILLSVKRMKGISYVRCLVPFTRLEFPGEGNVTCCCSAYTKIKSVGNIKYKTIEEIWNGREIRRFRKRLLLNQINKTCEPNCPFLFYQPISINSICINTEEGIALYENISRGRSRLASYPLWFNLSNHSKCNLNCIMCGRGTNLPVPEHVRKTHKEIKEYFDKKIILCLAGNGEPLFREDTRELLQNFNSEKYKNVRFEFLTNGLLFQTEMWETIKHNNYSWANISIDAATKKTYEKIRRGGNWEKLMKALEVFKKAKEEGRFWNVAINMTVMRSNFKEIPQFIELAREKDFITLFSVIRGNYGDENIFESNDKEALRELKAILSDPNLYGDDVDMIQLFNYVPQKFRSRLYNHLTAMAYRDLIIQI